MAKCPYSFVIPSKDGTHYYIPEHSVHGCITPIRGIQVPCGKCLICRRNRAAEWAARLTHELQYHSMACFITLTYSDDKIPVDVASGKFVLNKSDLQKFWKRLRKHLGKDYKIKYFSVGEYGERTGRPHYHAIVFGWCPDPKDMISLGRGRWSDSVLQDIWKHGHVQVGSAESKSIYYVTGYMLKKLGDKMLNSVAPPFLAASAGIGLQFALQYSNDISSGQLRAEGVSVPIPKYYLKHVSLDREKADTARVKAEVDVRRHYVERGTPKSDVLAKVVQARRQSHSDLIAKRALSSRNNKDSNI